jgi:DNA-binding IclR family transcriptional regulator
MAAADCRPIVTPFARALSILSAFTPADRWLCNSQFSERTGLPASTVTRMTRTLVTLGYLRRNADTHRFSLSPSALALGYRAAADTEIHRVANLRMSRFAERYRVNVHLSSRDRLDLVVIDSCRTSTLPAALQPGIGTRLMLTSSAAGWALLAGLPDAERDYLLRSAERHTQNQAKPTRWRSSQVIGQIRENGFCVVPGQSGHPMTVVAAPIHLPGQAAPLAVSCMGPAMLVGQARSMRELGPALVCMAQDIQCAKEPA